MSVKPLSSYGNRLPSPEQETPWLHPGLAEVLQQTVGKEEDPDNLEYIGDLMRKISTATLDYSPEDEGMDDIRVATKMQIIKDSKHELHNLDDHVYNRPGSIPGLDVIAYIGYSINDYREEKTLGDILRDAGIDELRVNLLLRGFADLETSTETNE